jgi:hypothetical protein
MKMNSFQELIEVFNIQLQYETIIEDHSLAIPSRYRTLNDKTARWCINNSKQVNKGNHAMTTLRECALSYLEQKATVLKTKFIDQKEYDDAA